MSSPSILVFNNKLKKFAAQMLWRINEGQNINGVCEAYYVLGLFDNGSPGHVETGILDNTVTKLKMMADICKAYIENVVKLFINNPAPESVIIWSLSPIPELVIIGIPIAIISPVFVGEDAFLEYNGLIK